MKRKLLVPTLAAAAMLAGCATGYQYRSGNGDYYYGQPTVQYNDYGYGGYGYGYPGGWGGSLGFGYGYGGYGYGGWGYGYPYWGYGYPWYYGHSHGHHHHHHGDDDSDSDVPPVPPSKPSPPPHMGVRPPSRPLLPGPTTRTPRMVRDESLPAPTLSPPMPARPSPTPVVAPRSDPGSHSPPPRIEDRPRFQPAIRTGEDRDDRRRSNR